MTISVASILRATMATIAGEVRDLLIAREKAGPPEQALDDYIPLLDDVATRLSSAGAGSAVADAARATRLVTLALADEEVDRWYRHTYGYLAAEGLRRTGVIVPTVQVLTYKAFPDGLDHVDDRIEDENTYLHKALTVLKDAEHAATLAEIELPAYFLDKLEKALGVSDAALADVTKARDDKSGQVSAGRGAEDTFIDIFVRLRKYIGSRATRKGNPARYEEGLKLLAPLLKELARLRAEAAAKATREREAAKAKAEAEEKAKAEAEAKVKAEAEKTKAGAGTG